MAASGNNRTLVAAIRADVSAALASARQLADGFVRVGSAVRASDEQIKEAGKLLGTLRIKSESWTKAQIEGIQKNIEALNRLRAAGAVTANEYDRFTAAARARLVRLGETLGQDMRTNAQKAADGLASLGVKSEASQKQAQAAIKQTIKELRALKAAGEITAKDLANAMKAANKALGKDVRTLSEKIRDAMDAVGVRRTVDVNKDISAQKRLIAAYEDWGRKGKMSADDVARAVAAARKKIEELNKELGKDVRTGRQRAQAITSKYGVDTKAETEKKIALIQKEIAALENLKRANQIDPSSFNAAIASMNKKLRELNKSLGLDTRTSAEKAADVMKKFGVTGEAAVKKTVSEIRQQIIEMNKARKAGEITERDFVASYRKMRAEIKRLNESIGTENKSAAQRAQEAWTAFGLKRKKQIEEEIAGVKKTAQEALKAANLSAGERYLIEKTLADKVRALNKELAKSVATEFQQRMTAAGSAASSASQKLLSGAMAAAPMSLAAGAVDRSAFQRAVDMDKSWRSAVSKMPGETKESLDKLYKEVMRLGVETIFTGAEVAKGAEMMGGMGTSAKDMTDGGLAAATYLASALDVDMSEASSLLAIVAKQFKYGGDQLMEVADMLVGMKNNTPLSGHDLKFLMSMGGGVTSLIGKKSLEEFAAIQVMNAYLAGSGSDSGTSTKTGFLNMVSPEKATAREKWGLDFFIRAPEVVAATKAATARVAEQERLVALYERREIQSRANPNATDESRERASEALAQSQAELERVKLETTRMIQKAEADAEARGFKTTMKGMRAIIQILEDKKNSLPEDKWLALASEVGGQDAVRQIAGLADGGVAGFDAAVVKVRSGDVQKSSEEKLAGLYGSLERMKGAWETMLVSIVTSGIDQVLISIMDTLQDLFMAISNLSPAWKNMIGAVMVLVAVVAPALLLFSGLSRVFGVFSLLLGAIGPSGATAAASLGRLSGFFKMLANAAKFPIKAIGWLLKTLFSLGASGVRFIFTRLVSWIGSVGLATFGLPALATVLFVGLGVAIYYWRKEIGDFLTWAGNKMGDLLGLEESTKKSFGNVWRGSVIGGFFSRENETGAATETPAFARGVVGLRGPGSGTSDSILARLSAGESVIPADATRYWGQNIMRGILNMDPSSVMRPVPVLAGLGLGGGGRASELAPINLYFEGGSTYQVMAAPSVAAQMSADQNLKRMTRKTNPNRGFR